MAAAERPRGITRRKAHHMLEEQGRETGGGRERPQMAWQEESTVMLSAAKHLDTQRERPFAAAQGDNVLGDHKGSPLPWTGWPCAAAS